MLVRNFAFPGPTMAPPASAKNPRERSRGEQLLAEIEAFMARNRFSATRFGREAMRNERFVWLLQEGLDPQELTQSRVRKFIAENGR